MIVSVVSLYYTYLGGLSVRLTFSLLFSSFLNHLWCLVSSPMMGRRYVNNILFFILV